MGKQIVVSENKVIAYGEDCFSVTNDTVMCANTGNVYHNATVVNVDSLPEDIDCMCYKYDMGQFRCDVSRARVYRLNFSESKTYILSTPIYKVPNFDAGRHLVFVHTEMNSGSGGQVGSWSLMTVGKERVTVSGNHFIKIDKDGTISLRVSASAYQWSGFVALAVVETSLVEVEV